MNDTNEIVTKGFLRDTLRDAFSKFENRLAILLNKNFQDIEARMATKENLLALTERVDKIDRHLTEHDQRFDELFHEIKDIRREIKENDTRADVVDLQVRVGALERQVKLKTKP